MAEIGDMWTRWIDVLYAGGEVQIIPIPYRVIKVTPCGVRLETGKFVLNNSRKRFACKTSEEALSSFVIRKRHQCAILRTQLRRAEEALELGKLEQKRSTEWMPPLT